MCYNASVHLLYFPLYFFSAFSNLSSDMSRSAYSSYSNLLSDGKGVKRTKIYRRFFESFGRTIEGPTPSYEDNNVTIHQIQANKFTPRIKHLDIVMTWLHEQDTYKTYVTIYCRTDLNKSDMNTKEHGGQILQTKN